MKVSKLKVLVCTVLLILSMASTCFASVGVVQRMNNDYCIVETDMGYTCAEIYTGGYAVFDGTVLYGDMNSYAMQDWVTESGSDVTVFVDEIMLSYNQAVRWLYSH